MKIAILTNLCSNLVNNYLQISNEKLFKGRKGKQIKMTEK